MHGGIHGRGSVASEWDFGLDIEASRAMGCSLIGALLDRRKCFDFILPEIPAKALTALGMDKRLETAILGFYEQSIRYMRFNN